MKLKTNSFDGVINKVKVSGFRAMLFFAGESNVSEPEITFKPQTLEKSDENGDWNEIYYNADELGKSPSRSLYDELEEFGDAVITLNDGTTVKAKLGSLGTRSPSFEGDLRGEIELHYTYPIAPADVSSITFGDYTINF